MKDAPDYTATSDASGAFSLKAPYGDQQLAFTLSGYSIPAVGAQIAHDETTQLSRDAIMASPILPRGMYRIVLTWGSRPADLDAHLTTPSGEDVNFSHTRAGTGEANLDVDCKDGYGPETVTITSAKAGQYMFYVRDYSNTGALAGCGARVQLFDETGLSQTFIVPSSGSGNEWKVFVLDGLARTVRVTSSVS